MKKCAQKIEKKRNRQTKGNYSKQINYEIT